MAEHYRTRRLWYSPAAYLHLYVFGIGLLFGVLLTLRRVTVTLPFCRRHCSHWFRRSLFTWASVPLLLAFMFLTSLWVSGSRGLEWLPAPVQGIREWLERHGGDISRVLLAGVLFAWPHFAVGLQMTAVRPLLWPEGDLILINVSERFVERHREELEAELHT